MRGNDDDLAVEGRHAVHGPELAPGGDHVVGLLAVAPHLHTAVRLWPPALALVTCIHLLGCLFSTITTSPAQPLVR